jgi:hypothetical protein
MSETSSETASGGKKIAPVYELVSFTSTGSPSCGIAFRAFSSLVVSFLHLWG